MNYDLEERTAQFGENIIVFCKKEVQELTLIFQKIYSSLNN